MKLQLALLLLAVIGVTTLASTCVAVRSQHGPTGPWVGEVWNNSAYPIDGGAVAIRITDATGKVLPTRPTIPTCPLYLAPGEHGTFEVFAPERETFTPPLRLDVDPRLFGPTGEPGDPNAPSGRGLDIRQLAVDRARGLVVAEILNRTDSVAPYVAMCANLRDENGSLIEVAANDPVYGVSMPILALEPGERRIFTLYFNSMPRGDVEFVARRNRWTRSTRTFSTDSFRPTSVQYEEVASGTILKVVGEVDIVHGFPDVGGMRISAHVEDRFTERADGVLAGCAGFADEGMKAPVAFAIPVSSAGVLDEVVIEQINATPNQGLHRLDVLSAHLSPSRGGSSEAQALVSNPNEFGLRIRGVCISVRDSLDRLVGTSSFADGRYVGPGERVEINGTVERLEPGQHLDVIAFGLRSSPPGN